MVGKNMKKQNLSKRIYSAVVVGLLLPPTLALPRSGRRVIDGTETYTITPQTRL